jgi:glycosyltransferase involved in cell wall biosynthesis
MACGCAVITSRIAGAAEKIHFGEDALEHSPSDYVDLAHKIRHLIEDTGLRRRLGERAYRTASSLFDRSRMASDMIRLYPEVVPPETAPNPGGKSRQEVRS